MSGNTRPSAGCRAWRRVCAGAQVWAARVRGQKRERSLSRSRASPFPGARTVAKAGSRSRSPADGGTGQRGKRGLEPGTRMSACLGEAEFLCCSLGPNTELDEKENQEVIFPAFKVLADSRGNKTHLRKTGRSKRLELFHSEWAGGGPFWRAVVSPPAPGASPGSLLEMQVLRPGSRLTKPALPEVGPRNLLNSCSRSCPGESHLCFWSGGRALGPRSEDGNLTRRQEGGGRGVPEGSLKLGSWSVWAGEQGKHLGCQKATVSFKLAFPPKCAPLSCSVKKGFQGQVA